MLRALGTLTCLALLLAPTADADEKKQKLTDEEGVDAALEAFEAGRRDDLVALAETDSPDPWILVEELCGRGAYDAAEALATAVSRPRLQKLPAYVEAHRARPTDPVIGQAFADSLDPVRARRWQDLLDLTDDVPTEPDRIWHIRLLQRRAMAFEGLKRWAEAAEVFGIVGLAAKAVGWYARSLPVLRFRAARCASRAGDPKSQLRFLEAAAEVAAAVGDSRGVAEIRYETIRVFRALGDMATAISTGEAAVELLKKHGTAAKVGRAYVELGHSLGRGGDPERAVEAFEAGLETVDDPAKAGAYLGLGQALVVLGRNLEAIEPLKRAYTLYDAKGGERWLAETSFLLGLSTHKLGRYAEARSHYRRAFERYRSLGNPTQWYALLDLGICEHDLGEYSRAFAIYRECLEHAESVKDKVLLARALSSISNMHAELGRGDAALATKRRVRDLKRELGDAVGEVIAEANIAAIQLNFGRYDEAAASFKRVIEMAERVGAPVYAAGAIDGLGRALLELGDHDAALEHLERALAMRRAIGDQHAVAHTRNAIGACLLRLDQPGEALRHFEGALDDVADLPTGVVRATAERGRADALLALDRPLEALIAARRAVTGVIASSSGLAEGEGAESRESFAGLFETATLAALRADTVEGMAWILEQGRSVSLREGIGSREALESAVIPDSLLAELRAAREREQYALRTYLAVKDGGRRKDLRAALKAWRDARTQVERTAEHVQREAKRTATIGMSAPDDVITIRSRLKPTDALVLYGSAGNVGTALVVRRKGARVVELASAEEISGGLEAFLGAERIEPQQVEALQATLVGPLELQDDVERVLVSPVDTLTYLPFSLLFPDHEVCNVPSGTVYGLLLEDATKRGSKTLALGDPDYRTLDEEATRVHRAGAPGRLAPLPATRAEARTVGDVTLLGRDATEAEFDRRVRAESRWRAVHLACHGLVDAERPMLSSLALSADGASDGFLTALEILRMRVPADLVVMSACDTARGRIYRTEGVLGLARAFMYAGTPRVICSLWKVDDAATQALMVKFYELWNPTDGSEGITAAAALKQAQAFVRDHSDHPEWRHPYYWAAWVLWGLPD